MKKLILLFSMSLIFNSCINSTNDCVVKSNGFTKNQGQTIMMGSQSTVDIFKEIDKAWADRDYEALKTFISNNAELEFEDGQIAKNGEEFTAILESKYQESLSDENKEWAWVNTYAFAIKPSKPEGSNFDNNRGEWVTAGFEGSDGFYMEWYQIENGKLLKWSQTKRSQSK